MIDILAVSKRLHGGDIGCDEAPWDEENAERDECDDDDPADDMRVIDEILVAQGYEASGSDKGYEAYENSPKDGEALTGGLDGSRGLKDGCENILSAFEAWFEKGLYGMH